MIKVQYFSVQNFTFVLTLLNSSLISIEDYGTI
jgi:hypothetical protein